MEKKAATITKAWMTGNPDSLLDLHVTVTYDDGDEAAWVDSVPSSSAGTISPLALRWLLTIMPRAWNVFVRHEDVIGLSDDLPLDEHLARVKSEQGWFIDQYALADLLPEHLEGCSCVVELADTGEIGGIADIEII